MLDLLHALLATARSSLMSQRELALENLALRQQRAVLKRRAKRPKLTNVDRARQNEKTSGERLIANCSF